MSANRGGSASPGVPPAAALRWRRSSPLSRISFHFDPREKLYYANLVIKNFVVTGNEFIDDGSKGPNGRNVLLQRSSRWTTTTTTGDSNTVGPVTPSFPEFIVESRSGGQKLYEVQRNQWGLAEFHIEEHSKRTSLLELVRGFATLDTKNDVARFTLAGIPGVPAGQHYYKNLLYDEQREFDKLHELHLSCAHRASGVVSGTFDVIPANTGNTWYQVGGVFLLDSSRMLILKWARPSSTTTPQRNEYTLANGRG
ncbi:MAG: hypothetical protein KatS3mg130_0495 [Candidatus Sumerlaea sp.]|nr:MAG: hypothetical protein KatS3mg130_0495 [Candidatus Sumerlaea sp.]